jgi:tetratricopeptide (TPR) repeat protein
MTREEDSYKRALALIEPHMRLAGRTPSASERRAADLRDGIAWLDIALRLAPENWVAWWLRGKAQQALDAHEAAHKSLQRACSINSGHLDVARELVAECLEIGLATEAVPIAEAIARSKPKDAGLLANLAVAYLLDGRIEDADRTTDLALQIDTLDSIIVSLKRRIDDVRTGRCPKPVRLSDLSRRR